MAIPIANVMKSTAPSATKPALTPIAPVAQLEKLGMVYSGVCSNAQNEVGCCDLPPFDSSSGGHAS